MYPIEFNIVVLVPMLIARKATTLGHTNSPVGEIHMRVRLYFVNVLPVIRYNFISG